MKSRSYQLGSVVLHTHEKEPTLYENGEPVTPAEINLRRPDVLLLQYMMIRSCESKERVYTVDELWQAGWPPVARAGRDEKMVDNVQGAMSRLRHTFPKALPAKGDGGWKLLRSVIDHTPVDLPLLVAHRVFIGCVLTSLAVVAVETPARAILSAFKVTVVQTTMRPWPIEATVGVFQGVCGALIYSVPIAFSLFYLWLKIYDSDPWHARYPRLLAAATSSAMGFLGGLIISTILVFAQNPVTLHEAGWIVSNRLRDAWLVSHVAWIMPWFGAWAGAAVALAIMQIISNPKWGSFLAQNPVITDPGIGLSVLWSLFRMSALSSLLFVFPSLLTAAGLFCLLPHNPVSRLRILGESIVVSMGGVGFTTGFLASLYSLTKGADIAGDRKCSLEPPTV